jgi:hypothetical protein
MVARHEVDICHARIDGKLADRVGIEALGGKPIGEFRVLGDRYLFAPLQPLVATLQRVQAIVDKTGRSEAGDENHSLRAFIAYVRCFPILIFLF